MTTTTLSLHSTTNSHFSRTTWVCRYQKLMPMPLTVSCFSKIQIGFTFLVPVHPGTPGQWAVKRVCVCDWPTDRLIDCLVGLQVLTMWYILVHKPVLCLCRLCTLDLNEARDNGALGWQQHQVDICKQSVSLQRDNHTNTSLLNFYRPDALSDAQPTASKNWRQLYCTWCWG